MKRGIFIVLEGPDRSGKSTQAALLKEWLEELGHEVIITREPGGTRLSEQIREILLDPKSVIEPMTELFLYETSRIKHTLEKIIPALKAGKVIISDRYTLSTTAYQGYGRGLDLKTVETLNRIATMNLKPDIIVVFDIPDKAFSQRERLTQGRDRIESEPDQFRKRVNRAYKLLARKPGVTRIDGGRAIEEIQKDIRARVAKTLAIKRKSKK
ncbi:MAG: dTMP kinase [Elusimicrobia bacterium CG_4_10_14_0_2_um_filter_56_8]|nr:MAG: dTMP kinase [Elusimicrobia bacterium CG1_02_56_21]PJA16209.1 MAG: dTMP kinase [Elusimicrobia bacterium CG_4_10_14_0_2_um_filter_56_8]